MKSKNAAFTSMRSSAISLLPSLVFASSTYHRAPATEEKNSKALASGETILDFLEPKSPASPQKGSSYISLSSSAPHNPVSLISLTAHKTLLDRARKIQVIFALSATLPTILAEVACIDKASDMETYRNRAETVAAEIAAGIVA